MNPLLRRILVRGLLVVVALAIIGRVYAGVLVTFLRMNAPDQPHHDEIFWRIPLTLAGFGLALTIVSECVAAYFRRGKPSPPPSSSAS